MIYHITPGESPITFEITDPPEGREMRENAHHRLTISTSPMNNTTVLLTDSELLALGTLVNHRAADSIVRIYTEGL